MERLYIDESGSMTSQHARENPYFVIAIVRANDPERLRKLHKRFVRKYAESLKAADTGGKMFDGDKFEELKGSALTPELKRAFVSFFCQNDTLDVFYIAVDNGAIVRGLYDNTARAFNYVLKLALEYYIKTGRLPDDEYIIQLDERNERTNTRHFLQNYLNTELRMQGVVSKDIAVQYFSSENNKLIQIADVLANLYFSELMTGKYTAEVSAMQRRGCLKHVFKFPK